VRGMRKLVLASGALVLLGAGTQTVTLPMQSEQDRNYFMSICMWDAMHNRKGVYIPQTQAQHDCACARDRVSKWVVEHNAHSIPRDVWLEAGRSCRPNKEQGLGA
jgi:hypothetical protein